MSGSDVSPTMTTVPGCKPRKLGEIHNKRFQRRPQLIFRCANRDRVRELGLRFTSECENSLLK